MKAGYAWRCGIDYHSSGSLTLLLQVTGKKRAAPEQDVPRDCVARNRGADFVQCPVPPRSARRNKALDPTALVGCPQASLLPCAVLAGQRRDYAPARTEAVS